MISFLLTTLWQGAFVVGITFAVTTAIPKGQAATRYAVWFAALVALALLPLTALLSIASPSAIPSSIVHTTTVATKVTQQAARTSGSWLSIAWIAGALLSLLRIVVSYARIAAIRRSAVPADALGPRVMTSDRLEIPIVAGIIRPVVIIPARLLRDLDSADLRCILIHERAHISRRDVLGNLIQRVFEAALFFNPWVYLIGHQLVNEREAACDDWVVCNAGDPVRYASCLAALGGQQRPFTPPLLTPSAIGSGRMLIGRIARILDGKSVSMKTNYLVVSAAVALFALLAFAFQTPPTIAAVRSSACPTLLASVVNAVPPKLPDMYAAAHPHGSAEVEVTIGTNGKASNARILKATDATIGKAAVKAALQSTYSPARRDCKTVSGNFVYHAQFESP